MRQDIVIERTVSVSGSGHPYRQGRIGTKTLRVVFDTSVVGDPADIPHHLLTQLVRQAERDGRLVDVFKPWSAILEHRLAAVTDFDLAELPSRVWGDND